MKNLLIVILLMTVATTIFAQNATISGQTFDKTTQEVLAYVSIIVQNSKDSTMITGSISDENGRFVLSNIPKGNYRFRASFVGYKNFEIPLLVGSLNSVYDLGKIVLELSTQQLDEIVVKGEKETVSSNLEKKTFVMADNVSGYSEQVILQDIWVNLLFYNLQSITNLEANLGSEQISQKRKKKPSKNKQKENAGYQVNRNIGAGVLRNYWFAL